MEPPMKSIDINIDPVCGMQVTRTDPRLMLNHEGRTFYFCADVCRDAFSKAPKKYIATQKTGLSGWWQRYLNRLNKATGGTPPKCCG